MTDINVRKEVVEYKCTICDKIFSHRSSLRVHKNSIHENKRYQCIFCNYIATQLGHLNGHVAAQHKGVKYKCKKCDQDFKYDSNLRKHFI